MTRGKRLTAALATIAVAALGLAACGSDDEGSDSSSSGGDMSLTIGIPSVSTVSAELYIAKVNGYFDDAGVDVDISNEGANAPTQAAAGRVDMIQLGTSGAFQPTLSGRPMSVVYWFAGNTAASVTVASGSSITEQATVGDTIMELAGKRASVQGVGSSSYGNATAYNSYIEEHGGEPMKLVNLADAGAIQAQLLSNQIDAALGVPDYLATAIDTDKAKVIVKASDPEAKQILGGDLAAVSIWGLQKTVDEKPDAVAAFITGLRQAHQFLTTHTPEEVAAVLKKDDDFAQFSDSSLVTTLNFSEPFYSPNDGEITEDVWNNTLAALDKWGLGVDLEDPALSYDSMVDMGPWNDSKPAS